MYQIYFSKLGDNKDKSEIDPIEEIKKYKELLDSGIISQDEFNKKRKKDLLNL
ncbi:MAG: SHOCT domain-containing protein [Clostridium sp.]|nr:MAG: SHOCT domain-containing protein [Clostridium sp.]